MKMKGAVAAVAALLSLSASGSLTTANDVEYLEPNVQRVIGVLPLSVCKHLIDLGEEAGFVIEEESIDEDEQSDPTQKYIPSQTIDVYDNGSEPDIEDDEPMIENEAIWNALQPWIPKIKQIVKDNRNKEAFSKYYPDEPDREPDLNWIFFRKYSPNDARNSLKHHHDTNMNTVNIELSNDYKGGGIFYIKPLASTGEIATEYDDRGYEWIDTVKRGNTSDIVFPDLHAGDAIFYNYTVEHGVAPVEEGIRYSMAFFFDMDNPAVSDDFSEDSGDDSSEDGYVDEDEFEVELHNGLPDIELDIVLRHEVDGEEVWKRVLDKVRVGETVVYYAYEGDLLRALRARTDEIVADFEIERHRSRYTISQADDGSVHTEL